jgi:hypothetical protein
MATSAQLERKAEGARGRLSDRIDYLRHHVSPTTVVSDLLGSVNPRTWGDDVLPILAKQARNNPIASMLIAAGVGWLIFSEVRGPVAKSLGLKSFGLMTTRQTAKGGRKRNGLHATARQHPGAGASKEQVKCQRPAATGRLEHRGVRKSRHRLIGRMLLSSITEENDFISKLDI